MAAMLTFHPRRALLEAAAAGTRFAVPTHHDPSRAVGWEHRFELRPGKYTLWDQALRLTQPRGDTGAALTFLAPAPASTLEVYDFPGQYAQRFDGVDKDTPGAHSHAGQALYVGTRESGIYIHAWPVCNLDTCVIVLQQWDLLRRALANEARLSFALSL